MSTRENIRLIARASFHCPIHPAVPRCYHLTRCSEGSYYYNLIISLLSSTARELKWHYIARPLGQHYNHYVSPSVRTHE